MQKSLFYAQYTLKKLLNNTPHAQSELSSAIQNAISANLVKFFLINEWGNTSFYKINTKQV